jgi:hypothetical protein
MTHENEDVTKMTQSATMGGVTGRFIAIFWIAKYLQRLIYMWNKISKHIMF